MSALRNLLTRLPEREVSLLHLGDSYTCAEGIDARDGWPALLKAHLVESGWTIDRQEILATTGWTTGELLAALKMRDLRPEWNLVTLCIGVNNQYRGLDLKTYRQDLMELVRVGMGYCRPDNSCPLILLSIPDWGRSPFARDRDARAVSREIDAFNAVIEAIADHEGLPFLNWTPLSRSCAEDPGGFAPDGLHPSASQHAAWANKLITFLHESETQY